MTSRLRVAPKTWVQSRIRVVEYISAMSAARVVRIPGRWTFTATASPLWRTARWTWPIDAAANDSWLNDRKMTSGSAPSSWRTISRTSSYENGSTWFSSLKSSSQYAAGSRSNRRASIWPSLIQAPPRRSNARRSRTGPGRRSDPGQVEGRGDEEREEDDEDVPDPTRVPEQRSHVASAPISGGSPPRVAAPGSSATRGPGAGLEPSGSLVIHGDAPAPRRQGGLLLPFATGPDELRERPP